MLIRLLGSLFKNEEKKKCEQDMEIFKLYTILTNHDDWWNGENLEKAERDRRNEEAKEALKSYHLQLKKIGAMEIRTEREMSSLYKERLIRIDQAFKQNMYMRVCYEIISLMYYEPFWEESIRQELGNLLGRNLRAV